MDLEVVELVEEVARVGGQPAHNGDRIGELLVPDPPPTRGPDARGAQDEVGAPQLAMEPCDLLLVDAVAGGPLRDAVADEPLGHHADQPRRRADGLADGVEGEWHWRRQREGDRSALFLAGFQEDDDGLEVKDGQGDRSKRV